MLIWTLICQSWRLGRCPRPGWSWIRLTSNLSLQSSLCQKHIRYISMFKKSFLTDLSLDLDVSAMKKEGRCDELGIQQFINEKLEQKCSEAIRHFSAEETRMLKIIQLEHSFLYAEGYAIIAPELMTNQLWIQALTLSTQETRMEYYYFLQQNENIRSQKIFEQRKTLEPVDDNQETDKKFLLYNNAKLTRTSDYGLASAMTHGVPLVFDLGFEDWMGPKEYSQISQQLWEAYVANKADSDPFHFIFTSCEKKRILYRTLELRHSLKCEHFLVSETERRYLDLFDRSKLVYLSAHAKQTMTHFDPSRVYILGAYADARSALKFGPGKAREQGIDCMRLPIDLHLKWRMGTKDFELPWVVQILSSVKSGKGWKEAFASVVPSRNYRGFRHGKKR